VTNYIVLLLSI